MEALLPNNTGQTICYSKRDASKHQNNAKDNVTICTLHGDRTLCAQLHSIGMEALLPNNTGHTRDGMHSRDSIKATLDVRTFTENSIAIENNRGQI